MTTKSHNKTRYTVIGAVSDADFLTDEMSSEFSLTELSQITFYADDSYSEAVKVTPTTGTVKVTLAPDGINFRTVDQGTFDAAEAYNETRVPPNAIGLATRGKLTLTGVDVATHFKAVFWRN